MLESVSNRLVNVFSHFGIQVLVGFYFFVLHNLQERKALVVIILLIIVFNHQSINVSQLDSILAVNTWIFQELFTYREQLGRVIFGRNELFNEKYFLLK